MDKSADWDGLQPVHAAVPDVAPGVACASGGLQGRPGRRYARAPGRSADGVCAAGQGMAGLSRTSGLGAVSLRV
jgi:hypothetical protein